MPPMPSPIPTLKPPATRLPPITWRMAGAFSSVFLLGLAITFWGARHGSAKYRHNLRRSVFNRMSTVRARIEGLMSANFYLVEGLVNELCLNPNMTAREFEQRALLLKKRSQLVSHIAASEGWIIKFVCPLQGNERALGLDYNQVPEQKIAIDRAIALGGLLVAGPVELVQGGKAFIGRTPVFTLDGAFWGLVSTPIRVENFYANCGLNELADEFNVAIKGKDSLGDNGEPFFGDPALFRQTAEIIPVSLPNGKWMMAASPKSGWDPPLSFHLRLAGFGTGISTLLAIVAAMLARSSDYRRLARALIYYQANSDGVTGLPNRNFLEQTLETLVEMDNPSPFLLILVDLDQFRSVNDHLGHLTGDSLLKQVGARLHSILGGNGLLVRFGGDEFVVLLEMIEATLPEDLVNPIMNIFKPPFSVQNQEIHMTASLGGAHFPQHSQCAKDLVRLSEQAMYAAKKAGRNRFTLFNTTLLEKVELLHRIRNDLRKALDRQELEVFYQPIVSLEHRPIIRCEALVRWRQKNKTYLSPATFIPIAEQTGLIRELGDYVFQRACLDMVQLSQEIGRPIHLSVNRSPEECSPANAQAWLDTMVGAGFPPEQLTVEITEGLFIEDNKNPLTTLMALRNAGVKVALDDFGTGYSSLSYLKRFPVDMIKIDQSFIADISRGNARNDLVQAVLDLARIFHLETVAEGVEEAWQMEYLTDLGCHFVQGYYISRPVNFQQYRQFVHKTLTDS